MAHLVHSLGHTTYVEPPAEVNAVQDLPGRIKHLRRVHYFNSFSRCTFWMICHTNSWYKVICEDNCRLKKKSTAYKLRVMFYLAGKTEDLSLRHSISDNSERPAPKGQGGWGEPEYRGVFATKDQVVQTPKDYS